MTASTSPALDDRPEGPVAATTPAARTRPGYGGRALWVALAVAAVSLLAVATFDGGGAESDTERIQRLSASYACPACQGESVAESNAAVATTIREFIADEVSAGSTDEMIRDELVSSYGASVLLNPPADGIAQLLWVLPVVVLVTGAAGVVALIDRGRGEVAVSDDDRALVESALLHWRAGHDEPGAVDAVTTAATGDRADPAEADPAGCDPAEADGAGAGGDGAGGEREVDS